MAKKSEENVESKDDNVNQDKDELDDITEENLESVDGLKAEPETVRQTLERTLKETEEADKKVAPEEPIKAPDEWDDEGKRYFGSLRDKKVQEFILARHNANTDASKKITNEYTSYKTAWDPVVKVIEPYVDVLKNANISPAEVVQRYINAELWLNREPVNALQWLMKLYKVTPEQLSSPATSGNGEVKSKVEKGSVKELDPNDPRDKVLLDLQKDKQDRENRERQFAQAESERNKGAVAQAMKNLVEEKDKDGNPINIHANDDEIKKLMGVYITTGVVPIKTTADLPAAFKRAYDMAVNAHTPTREAVFKARMDDEAKKKADEDKRKLTKAKRLGQSVSGDGTSGTRQTTKRGLSVGESLRKTAEDIGFGRE